MMAEQIKIDMGSVLPYKDEGTISVRGRDLITGIPRNIEVSSSEVQEALEDPTKAIVEAVAHFNDPKVIAEVSKSLGDPMLGIEIESIPKEQLLQERGW